MSERQRILLIEDDEGMRELVRAHIEYLGFDLDFAADGMAGLEKALGEEYALILLDLNLPRLGGHEVCKQLRKEKPLVPVIMLTARGEEIDKVLGLELGADDYLTKPFSVPELTARINARLRIAKITGRASTAVETTAGAPEHRPGELLRFGDLQIDLFRRRVTVASAEVQLTPKEFDLLAFLGSNPGRPFSREELLSEVWGFANFSYEGNVNALITRLRKKIEPDAENPTYIRTVWGVGYRMAERNEL